MNNVFSGQEFQVQVHEGTLYQQQQTQRMRAGRTGASSLVLIVTELRVCR